MDEFMARGGLDFFWSPLLTILALLGVGLAVVLAPAVGYTSYNRGLMLGALWALVGRLAVDLFRIALVVVEVLDGKSSSGGKFLREGPIVAVLFLLAESGLLVLAMGLFVAGLTTLRREPDLSRPPRAFRDD
jgi:hypothetical protein